RTCDDVVDVEIATFEWVTWWNETRIHQGLGYRTPAEVESEFCKSNPGQEKRNQGKRLGTKPVALHFLRWAITTDEPIREIDYVNSLNRAGNKKTKERPMAIVFCIDQIPRAFTTILRTKAKRRQKT